MSPEAQRIAIAEACGWTVHKWLGRKGEKCTGYLPPQADKSGHAYARLPDYLNDLNAMAEAVGLLSDGEKESYREELADLIHLQTGLAWCDAATAAIDASASQRAEALLKSTGNWDDAK